MANRLTQNNPHVEYLKRIDPGLAVLSSSTWPQVKWNLVTVGNSADSTLNSTYSEAQANKVQAAGTFGNQNRSTITLHPEYLHQYLSRRKPAHVLVCPTCDLFHADVPDEFLDQVFEVMSHPPWHIYQILTKRSKRMSKYFSRRRCPMNVWLGVVVENREKGLRRLDYLRGIDCRMRFASMEPLLEDLGRIDLTGFDWVIVGGESGPKARATNKSWVERIQRQAARAQVPFYFKQWGAWGPDGVKRSTKANSRMLNGETHDGYPMPLLYWYDDKGSKRHWSRSKSGA